MREVRLHDFYLWYGEYPVVAIVYLPFSEPSAWYAIGGKVLYKSGFVSERSAAWYRSASAFVIFIMSVLISFENMIVA